MSNQAILVLAYREGFDPRQMGQHGKCSGRECNRKPVAIVGAFKARRYLCGKHAREWGNRHGYSRVDAT